MSQLPLEAPLQMTWRAPKGKGACGRNPDAGPGSCNYWWEGCPRGETRGCYQLWAQAHHEAGHEPDGPGKAKVPTDRAVQGAES